jgi:Uma2 family endonuclease
MVVLDRPPQVIPSVQVPLAPSQPERPLPRLHRWTPEQYVKMIKAGVFEDCRCELIDGEIFDMAAQNNPHVFGISRTTRVLLAVFDETWWVTIQSTVRLPRGDMPDPDFAIRPGPGSADNDVQPLPLLVIEVSDDTLLSDQVIKSSMYAANGIQDYWILNVRDRQLEIYRDPMPDETRRHGYRYASINTFAAGAKVSALAKPETEIEVARMLP